MKTTTPHIGQLITVHGIPCEIVAIHPAGTLDVAAINPADNRAFRLTGLCFGSTFVQTARAQEATKPS